MRISGGEAGTCILISPPGDSNAKPSLRITASCPYSLPIILKQMCDPITCKYFSIYLEKIRAPLWKSQYLSSHNPKERLLPQYIIKYPASVHIAPNYQYSLSSHPLSAPSPVSSCCPLPSFFPSFVKFVGLNWDPSCGVFIVSFNL